MKRSRTCTSAPALVAVMIAATLLSACATNPGTDAPAIPPHGVIGVTDTHLDPEYWIRRQPGAGRTVLDASAIAAQNARLQQLDPSLHDVEGLPATLPASTVRGWIERISARPTRVLFDERGRELTTATWEDLLRSLSLESLPPMQDARFGLVAKRADLRTFPTRLRVFHSSGDRDIDRFQETALFPGTPVAIAHESRDGNWWFIVSATYAAWVEKDHIAAGPAEQVFAYTRKAPFLVVTGATARTVFTRERPEVSQLQLDMGVRVPLLADWPADAPVNGQHPYAAHVIELPIRTSDGSLQFTPALLPKTADVAPDYLPLNRANLLRQSFKFLGERYGWGHAYNGRDCSGFVSEIYRSFGVQLPRNTRDQSASPALNRVVLGLPGSNDYGKRLTILRELQVGDLLYIPGHVMMVIGHYNGTPYVIHDTTGISYRDRDGSPRRVKLNGVSVTPIGPLLLGRDEPLAEGITGILRIRPQGPP